MGTGLRAHFDRVVDLPESGRRHYYEQAKLAPEQVNRIEALLQAERDAPDEPPPLPALDALLERELEPGTRLGAFRVLRELGRGGMGAVYLAEREDGRVEQRVAIKLLERPLQASLRARFQIERALLAKLDHPGIGRFLDAGEDARGRPYLVMEHIDGAPLDRWCRERALGLRARVALLVHVLRAVAHAHASLVVHRDLKFANVLVDAQGRPRLIDFGIGRSLDDLRETQEFGRFLTLANAAPEQVRGEPAGIAADIHAVGLMLAELLTDEHPFLDGGEPIRAAQLEERILHRVPPAPSQALRRRQTSDPLALDRRARDRGLGSARELLRAIDADLDAIAAQALRKAPGERYRSADAFADDLERWLQGRPVQARPAGALYRLRKLAARHRLAVAAASLAVAVLLAATTAWWQRHLEARSAGARAERTAAFLVDVFSAGNPEVSFGEPATAADLLGAARAALAAQAGLDEADRRALAQTIAQAYLGLGLPQEARSLLEPWAGSDPRRDDGQLLATLLDARLAAGAEAESGALIERLAAAELSAERQTLVWLHRARWLALSGEREQAFAIAELLLPAIRDLPATRWRERLNALKDVAALATRAAQGRASAHALLVEVLAEQERLLGPEHPDLIRTLHRLAVLDREEDRWDAARARLDRAATIALAVFGSEHVQTARIVNARANLLVDVDAIDAAVADYRSVLEVLPRRLGAEHPAVAQVLLNLGMVLHLERGETAEGLALLERARAITGERWPPDSPNALTLAIAHAAALKDIGEGEAAVAALSGIVARLVADRRPRPFLQAWAEAELAGALHSLGRADEIGGRLHAALATMRQDPAFFGRYLDRAEALVGRLEAAPAADASR